MCKDFVVNVFYEFCMLLMVINGYLEIFFVDEEFDLFMYKVMKEMIL